MKNSSDTSLAATPALYLIIAQYNLLSPTNCHQSPLSSGSLSQDPSAFPKLCIVPNSVYTMTYTEYIYYILTVHTGIHTFNVCHFNSVLCTKSFTFAI
jgi:hypothetical protein